MAAASRSFLLLWIAALLLVVAATAPFWLAAESRWALRIVVIVWAAGFVTGLVGLWGLLSARRAVHGGAARR